jgi:hypothetical protein
MQILKGTKLLGYATVSQWILADGGKTVEMRLELKGTSGHLTKLHKVSTYDSKGRPKRMVLEITGGSRSETIVTFDAGAAHVSRIADGIAKNSDANRAVNSPWGDDSEFWFLRDHPKAGDHFRTLLFSIDTGEWVLTEMTYLGPKSVTVGGRTVRGNEVRTEVDGRSTVAYLDDRGDPIRVEMDGGVTMEQIVPGK